MLAAKWHQTPIRGEPWGSRRARPRTRSGVPTGAWRRSTIPMPRATAPCPDSSRSSRRTTSSQARAELADPAHGRRPRSHRRRIRVSRGGPIQVGRVRRVERTAGELRGRGRQVRPARRVGRAPSRPTGHPAAGRPAALRIRTTAARPARLAQPIPAPDGPRAVAGPRTAQPPARPPTRVPTRSRSSRAGAARPGTGRRAARTGRSTPRNTPTPASTAPSTRPVPAGPPERGASMTRRSRPTHPTDWRT